MTDAGGGAPIFEPATGLPLPAVPAVPPAGVYDAVRRARRAQPAWAARSFADRRRVLNAFKRALLDHAEELCDLLGRETGKTRMDALMLELFPAVSLTAHYARRARRILRDRHIGLPLFPHKASRIRYAPRGVMGSITAWNLPLAFFVSDVVTALAAGNGVVVKPSEYTPLTALRAKELCGEAGIPSDLVQVVPGGGAAGAALFDADEEDARADLIVFTGSVVTGRRIGAACGERLIPCILELGGSAAAIVRADADLDRAAAAVVWGAFANAGQLCVSVNRVLVDQDIAEPFTRRVVERARALRLGSGADAEVGAVTTAAQLATVERHVADALARGATVACGGTAPAGPGRFYPPTVLIGVTPAMAVMREETFGPVVAIAAFRDDKEAVRLANTAPAGLIGYVLTGSRRAGRKLARGLNTGTVIVNDVLYTYAVPQTPWGGVRGAGLGRVHGDEGLLAMCEARHLNEERMHLPVPWMFPYSAGSFRWLLTAMRGIFRWRG